MICVELDAGNALVATATPVEQCTAYVMFDVNEFQLYQQAVEISSEQVLYAFGWGFGAVVLFWYIGAVIGGAKTVVRKA